MFHDVDGHLCLMLSRTFNVRKGPLQTVLGNNLARNYRSCTSLAELNMSL